MCDKLADIEKRIKELGKTEAYMKIVASAAGQGLDAEIDERFGRCPYLVFVDTDTLEVESGENPGASASGGAGIVAAQSVAEKGVQSVLTGHIGPNAHKVLSQAGIQVFTDVSGKVRDAVERLKSGALSEASGPTVEGHFGQGRSR